MTPHDFPSKSSSGRPFRKVLVILCIVILISFAASAQNRFVRLPAYPAGGSLPVLLAQHDVNGDGNLDVLVMNANAATKIETVSLLPGNGTGGYGTPKLLAYFPVSYGIPLVADVNRDGHVDLIFYVASTHVTRVYLGVSGAFQSQAVVSRAGGCTNSTVVCLSPEIHVADVNGDGNPDLLMGFTDSTLYLSLGSGNGSFLAPVALDTRGESVLAYTTGDFNSDGLIDIAAAGWDGLQILLGNGDGTFRRGIAQFLGVAPGQILSADLRSNGKTDLILVNSLTSEEAQGACRGGGIFVLLGNGDGTFPVNATGYGAGQFTYGAVIADMNGDGRPDIVAANQLGASYSVLLNAGSGNFAPTVNYRAPEPVAGNFVVGDLNGDGRPEVTISAQAGVEVFRNTGGGGLFAPVSLDLQPAAQPLNAYASDLNHDHIPDLAMLVGFDTSSTCWQPYVWGLGEIALSNNGHPFAASAGFTFPGSYLSTFGLGDFNADGSTDIVVDASPRELGPEIQVQFNNGKGQFLSSGLALAPEGNYTYYNVAVGDFNRDGFADVALGAGDLKIGMGDGKGNFRFGPAISGADFSAVPVLVRDINADGKLDLINIDQSANAVDVLMGKGDGTFQAARSYPTVSAPQFVISGDFNRDHRYDLVVGGGEEVSLLLNNGNGTYAPAVYYPAGGPVSAIAVISLFGNGNEGVLVADGKDNKLFLLAGDGKGHFSAPIDYYPGGGNPQGLTVGDFNNDGAPDVAVADWSTSSYMVLYNIGGTSIALSASNTQPAAGTTVKFSVTVSASVPGAGTPTGTVAFKDGSATLGMLNLSGGRATFSTSDLSPGTHTIKASYYGSSNFNPHLSAGLTLSVR